MQKEQEIKSAPASYDISQTVCIDSPQDVCAAVKAAFVSHFPESEFVVVSTAFDDVARLYRGESNEYHACDTDYHDLRHILDVTLAVARLLVGYERVHANTPDVLGVERVQMGIIAALFHDIGYLRHVKDTRHKHGAEYTKTHVARGVRFLSRYLPTVGKASWVPRMRQLLHYTGYEKTVRMKNVRDHMLGCLLGTGDLIAQMSDRAYLERCRDSLYNEFRIGNVPAPQSIDGRPFESPADLLNQTPEFMRKTVDGRLNQLFGAVYRYAEQFFGGDNLYMMGLERNCAYLQTLLEEKRLYRLQRRV
ncbi:MAG: HD domain-containing protein [Pseudomonadales bacterium]